MNCVKLLSVSLLVLVFCSLESTSIYPWWSGWGGWWGYGAAVAAPLALAPVALAPAILATAPTWTPVPYLLCLQLLALRSILRIPRVAITSLVAGSGLGLIGGKLATLRLLHELEHVKHHGHGWGHGHSYGHGHGHNHGHVHHGHAHHAHHSHGWGDTHTYAHGHGWGWQTPLRTIIAARLRQRWARTRHLTSHLLKDYHAAAALYLANRLEHQHLYAHGHGHGHSYGWDGHSSHYHAEPEVHYDVDSHSHGHGHDDGYHVGHDDGYHVGGHDDGYHVEESQVKSSVVAPPGSGVGTGSDSGPSLLPSANDAVYIMGVMKHAAKPVTDYIYRMFAGGPEAPDGTTTRKKRSASGFPGLSTQESEKYLEQQFETLMPESPEKAESLIRVLRQAYTQSITDLGFDKEKVPDFVPMPKDEQNSTSSWVSELQNNGKINLDKREAPAPAPVEIKPELLKQLDQNLVKEIQEFFALLSSFDKETCLEKVVCDVHTNTNPLVVNPYEKNIVESFKLLGAVFTANNPPDKISGKYMLAASLGKENQSKELCQATYPDCPYSTKQVMEMGQELDKSSTFSISDYLSNHV